MDDLASLKRTELQSLAKSLNIKANQSSAKIIEAVEGPNEAVSRKITNQLEEEHFAQVRNLASEVVPGKIISESMIRYLIKVTRIMLNVYFSSVKINETMSTTSAAASSSPSSLSLSLELPPCDYEVLLKDIPYPFTRELKSSYNSKTFIDFLIPSTIKVLSSKSELKLDRSITAAIAMRDVLSNDEYIILASMIEYTICELVELINIHFENAPIAIWNKGLETLEFTDFIFFPNDLKSCILADEQICQCIPDLTILEEDASQDKEYCDYISKLFELIPIEKAIAGDKAAIAPFTLHSWIDEDSTDEELYVEHAKFMTATSVLCSCCPEVKATFESRVVTSLTEQTDKYKKLISVIGVKGELYPAFEAIAASLLAELGQSRLIAKAISSGLVHLMQQLLRFGVKIKDDKGKDVRYNLYKEMKRIEDGEEESEIKEEIKEGDEEEDDDDDDKETTHQKRPKTLLRYAVIADKVDIAKFLISEGADVNDEADGTVEQYTPNAYTHLGYAVEKSNFSMIRLLIESKADVEAISWVYSKTHDYDNHDEYTPLMIAVEARNKFIMKTLLDSKANANASGCSQLNPLVLIVEMTQSSYRPLKCEQAVDMSKLLVAAGGDAWPALEYVNNDQIGNPLHTFLFKEARWAKSKSFLMFLKMMAYSGSAASSSSSSSLIASDAKSRVFSSVDLIKLITLFIPNYGDSHSIRFGQASENINSTSDY